MDTWRSLLSMVYKLIDRFSEDIDLTYDIRKLLNDLMSSDEFLPSSRSQANKWTKAVRDRLPDLIAAHIQPVLEAALAGNLKIVPEGVAREALALDYANMLADAVMVGDALPFDQLMRACSDIETRVNRAAMPFA